MMVVDLQRGVVRDRGDAALLQCIGHLPRVVGTDIAGREGAEEFLLDHLRAHVLRGQRQLLRVQHAGVLHGQQGSKPVGIGQRSLVEVLRVIRTARREVEARPSAVLDQDRLEVLPDLG